MRRRLLVATLLVLAAEPALALDRVYTPPASSPCKTVVVNVQGAGADIAIGSTATTVLAVNANRCGAVIKNVGGATMRCSTTAPTSTGAIGFTLSANEAIILGLEGQQSWNCTRATGTSTSANVIEATP